MDNATVAQRLGGDVLHISARGMVFSGYRVVPGSTGAPGIQAKVGPTSAQEAQPGDQQPLWGSGLAPVVLVHGWPEFATCWEPIAQALTQAGHPVIAYDQRGYSAGARPEPVEAYTVAELVADLGAITDSLGITKFHLVGHDWGAVMGWAAAVEYADRIVSFTSLASAHTMAHGQALKTDREQYEKMAYVRSIRNHPAEFAHSLLNDGGAKLRALYGGAVPADIVESYYERLHQPGVMDAVLKYYQALGLGKHVPQDPITVPVTYIWGSEDVAFGRQAAESTADFVNGQYTFVELPGASHWLPEECPAEVAGHILAQLDRAEGRP